MTPTTLGHFEILDKLGEGGMGVLYRARDQRLGRTVAIKLLRADALGDESRTRRLVQEARSASSLNHPGIVTVYDIGEDPRFGTWIAMECVGGESLKDRLGRGPIPVAEALRLGLEVARALAAAHAAGIVHRDVKPANVMLTGDGGVKLLDFGLAKPSQPEPGAGDSRAATLEALTGDGRLVGTPAYMSPEQAEGRPVDARSDVFSFGAVLYAMLAGRPAFQGTSYAAILSAVLRDTPPPVRSVRPKVDRRVDAVLSRCLRKDPAERYSSAVALVGELEALVRPQPRTPAVRTPWVVALLLVVALLFLPLARFGWRGAQERWARLRTMPQIQRLADADDLSGAFRLAETVRPVLKGDPTFDRLWQDLTQGATVPIRTVPAGAQVSAKPYADPAAPWQELGRTPLEGVALPRVYTRFRLQKPGYATVEVAFPPIALLSHPPFKLVPLAQVPAGMVLVPGQRFKFHSAPEVDLPDFWLDRYEVTNREFAEFVKAGGYGRRQLWPQAFRHRGRTLSFEEGMALFRDRTGRPGPSTWELGSYRDGHGEEPVAGISWYEAAAYAAFAGRSLPTLHHWYRAADLSRFSDILKFSNFGGDGPRPVGQQPSLTSYGNYDMAGNVREWVWNEDASGRRYTLGGAWSDPTYLYTGPDALDPMDRSAIVGLRCALYPSSPPTEAFAPVIQTVRDLSRQRPADERAFRIYRELLGYDPVDLAARVEEVDDRSPEYRLERVSFTAAYGGERIPALLYLPKRTTPPFQTVVYFPPGSARYLRSIDFVGTRDFDYLVRSGRAVLFPVYQQTYQRRRVAVGGPNLLRETLTQRVQDVRRALDYLQTRREVDARRLAFYGLSMGADVGPMVGAVDDRLRTLVLVATALEEDQPPEVDAVNFAPRVRIPVLMINGRYDFTAPYPTHQLPLFRLLGTPAADKKQVVFDSGHVPPWPDVVRETLDWLDRYLGGVAAGPPTSR